MKLLASVRQWFTFRTVCAWCKPERTISGWPWAKQVSHGICPRCLSKELSTIIALPWSRSSHNLNPNPNLPLRSLR